MQSKDNVLNQIIGVNPNAEVYEEAGFIWVILPQSQELKIPHEYTCQNELHVTKNSLSLHHLYNLNGEFVFTVIARAKA